MSNVNEVTEKFEELEKAIKTHLEKVDPRLIVDLIFRIREGKKNPIYTIESFIKPNQNIDEIRNEIIEATGMIPSFYDNGTHIVVAHKIDFDMLKRINDLDFVETIRGTYTGSAASIGPVYEK
jgi:hypothetical protein